MFSLGFEEFDTCKKKKKLKIKLVQIDGLKFFSVVKYLLLLLKMQPGLGPNLPQYEVTLLGIGARSDCVVFSLQNFSKSSH